MQRLIEATLVNKILKKYEDRLKECEERWDNDYEKHNKDDNIEEDWGIKKDCTWLGYNLIEVEESHKPECLKGIDIRLYRIEGETGFKEAKDRIGQDRFPNSINGRSNLLGSYFIDYALYDDRHEEKYPSRILNPSIIKKLYEFVTR